MIHRTPFILALLFLTPLWEAQANTHNKLTGCQSMITSRPVDKAILTRIEAAKKRDVNFVERRLKVLTNGKDDTADPSVPIPMQLPSGRQVWAIYYSGGRVSYFDSLNDLLKGGVRDFEEIKFYTREMQPLVVKPYSLRESVWDSEPSFIESNGITLMIGHGGMMERLHPRKPARIDLHNYRRSRNAFSIEIKEDRRTGKIRQIWRSLGPIHDNKPTTDGRWTVDEPGRWHAHGYGSRLIRDAEGKPYRDHEGYMWMVYDQVSEDRSRKGGGRVPFATEIFARRMNYNLTRAVGPTVLLSSYTSPNLGRPFKATQRIGPQGEHAGYLIEGPSPILLRIGDQEFWVILFSAGDFVAEYGNYMMYREKSEGPIGLYRHVTDQHGELINLTAAIEAEYGLTWSGRLNPFYDNNGQLWGLAHGIFESDIPAGWPVKGWPRTWEESIQYARRGLLMPLEASIQDGHPIIKVVSESTAE